jgi:hypothetical protein
MSEDQSSAARRSPISRRNTLRLGVTAAWVAPVVVALGAGAASADPASTIPVKVLPIEINRPPVTTETPTGPPGGSTTVDGPGSQVEVKGVVLSRSPATALGAGSPTSAAGTPLASTGVEVGPVLALGAAATVAGAALVAASRKMGAQD